VIKLRADAGFDLPDLASIDGVVTVTTEAPLELAALYFDTAQLHLTRSGTILRRRTGGPDDGWQLKLPLLNADPDARLEVRRPVGPNEAVVPAELLGLARARTRGLPITPVVRIRTHRVRHRVLGPEGVQLAVLDNDSVTAEQLGAGAVTSSWHRLLITADEALGEQITERLLACGARQPAGVASGLAHTLNVELGSNASLESIEGAAGVVLVHLGEQLARLVALDPQVRLNSVDAVHQMRVATRRLRSGLDIFGPLFPAEATRPLRTELGWLAGVLGEARDAEVMHARLLVELGREPAETIIGPVRRRIDREMSQRHRQAHIGVVQALNSPRYLALLEALETFVTSAGAGSGWTPTGSEPDPGRQIQADLTALVARAHRRVLKAIWPAEAAPTAAEREFLEHEVRKAAKRARYAAQAVLPVIGKPAKRYARAAAAAQEVLGEHQDVVVLRAMLITLADRAQLAGESAFSYGRLHARLEQQTRLDQDEVRATWSRLIEQAAHWPA
jgi:CHAD domain-containing protein